VSDEHAAGWQLDEVIWVPHDPVYGSPQHACPGMQSEDALQFKPSTHERSVFSQVPSSEHLNCTCWEAGWDTGQTEAPGHVHGSPLSVSGQGVGGSLWSPMLQPAPRTLMQLARMIAIQDMFMRTW